MDNFPAEKQQNEWKRMHAQTQLIFKHTLILFKKRYFKFLNVINNMKFSLTIGETNLNTEFVFKH